MAESFDRAIVQVALRHVEVAGGYRRRVDLELVILARDVDAARVEVLDRVVRAVVAVGKARGGGSGSASEDLVAKADSEQRNRAQRLPRKLDRTVQHRRVTWSVGQHQAIGAERLHLRPRRGVRQHHDRASTLTQRAKDVELDTVVDNGDHEPIAVGPASHAQLGG